MNFLLLENRKTEPSHSLLSAQTDAVKRANGNVVTIVRSETAAIFVLQSREMCFVNLDL